MLEMLKRKLLTIENINENVLIESNPYKTSTPKALKKTGENHLKIIGKKIEDESKDVSLQFSDESWMEEVLQNIDELERNAKLDENGMKINVSVNDCQRKLQTVVTNEDADLFPEEEFNLLCEQQNNSTPGSSFSEAMHTDASTPFSEKDKDFESHQPKNFHNHKSLVTGDENNIDEKNVNNVSHFIKERLKQNAKCVSSKLSDISLLKDAVLAFALEEAEKSRELMAETCSDTFYGLPSNVKCLLKIHRGIENLYDWQHDCLTLSAIKEEKNLIYTLPTSGGKTLVAEILIFKRLLCNKQSALFILPYISIVQEKVRSLSPFAIELDFLIEEYAGSKGRFPPVKRRKRQTLFIATIEKAHSLINCFLELNRTEELGLVVVDELHMIGEEGRRGAILETALTKLIYSFKQTQIIGMSATIGNIEELQTFLRADKFCCNFRPVQLKEYLKIGDELWEHDPKSEPSLCFSRKLQFAYTAEMKRQDPDALAALVLEVIPENSCLLFCPTKKHCENVAKLLSQLLPKNIGEFKSEEKRSLLKALRNENRGFVCPVLSSTLSYGVAYHHGGLTTDERKLIEEAFLDGTLCCLVCTSTLAAGVNLPAKRVILRAPYVGNNFLTRSRYKQMIGRAGRAGLDTLGESILVARPEDKRKVEELLDSSVENCRSSLLYDGGKGLKVLLLSSIGLRMATSLDDLKNFVKSTLLSVQTGGEEPTSNSMVRDSLMWLKENGFIKLEQKEEKETLEVTKLGRATFKGGIDPDLANRVYDDLKKAQRCLALSSHLHLLYLATPPENPQIPVLPDIYFSAYMKLSDDDLHAARLIGVDESCVVAMASGRSPDNSKRSLVDRFYSSLVLYDLWKQKSAWDVSRKYGIHRGTAQNLLSNSVTSAAGILHFSRELEELWPYQKIFPDFVRQLSYCVTTELLPLMELPGVKRGRAGQLYRAGYESLTDVAGADPSELVRRVDYLPVRVARRMVSAAKMMVYIRAEELAEEAEEMMANLRTR